MCIVGLDAGTKLDCTKLPSHLSRNSLFGSKSGLLNLKPNLRPVEFLEKNFRISSIIMTGKERYKTTFHSAQDNGVTEKRIDSGCTYKISI